MGLKDKTLLEIWKETYPIVRPWVAIILVATFLTSVVIDNTTYKIGILSALAGNIVFLIFDLTTTLKTRLDNIDKNLREPQPPSFESFNEALPVIKKVLIQKLNNNKDVSIKILAVSAQFSWKVLIQTTVPALLKIAKNPKIHVEIAIVKPSVLQNWGLKQLMKDAQNTIDGIEDFKLKYKTAFSEGKLGLEIYLYDNLPHWHGILIDNDILFMGRCKWEIIDEKYHLLVGQIDYRQFRMNDRFGGNARIELVDNWFNTYKFRSGKIS
jgi:hypothetical protein